MPDSKSSLLKVRHYSNYMNVVVKIHWTTLFDSLWTHLFSPSGVNGLMMLGVVHEAVVFLLEQLYGSRHCRSYRFRFHKPEETDEPPINPHGSARAEIHHRLGWDLHTHTYILVSVVNSSFNIAYLNIGFNCNRHCEYSES